VIGTTRSSVGFLMTNFGTLVLTTEDNGNPST
jgi:hypothetical protein